MVQPRPQPNNAGRLVQLPRRRYSGEESDNRIPDESSKVLLLELPNQRAEERGLSNWLPRTEMVTTALIAEGAEAFDEQEVVITEALARRAAATLAQPRRITATPQKPEIIVPLKSIYTLVVGTVFSTTGLALGLTGILDGLEAAFLLIGGTGLITTSVSVLRSFRSDSAQGFGS